MRIVQAQRALLIGIIVLMILPTALVPLQTARASTDATINGSNLIFNPVGVKDSGGEHALGGSGSVKSYGDFFYTADTPQFVRFEDQQATPIDANTVQFSAIGVFHVDSTAYTTATFEKAATAGTSSYLWLEWYPVYTKWAGFLDFCHVYYPGGPDAGEPSTQQCIATLPTYNPSSAVQSGTFAKYSSPSVEIGWNPPITQFNWISDSQHQGASFYNMTWQPISMAASSSSIQELEHYNDKILSSQVTTGAKLDVISGHSSLATATASDLGNVGLSSSDLVAIQTQSMISKAGIHVDYPGNTDPANSWRTWTTVQVATKNYPQIGADYITAGSRPDPNTLAKVELSQYSISPTVAMGQATVTNDQGTFAYEYSGCNVGFFTAGGVTPHVTTSYDHPYVTVRVENNVATVGWDVKIQFICTAGLQGITSTALLGNPNVNRGDAVWGAFLSGSTAQLFAGLEGYSWQDAGQDVGSFMTSPFGQIIVTGIILVALIAGAYVLVVYVLPIFRAKKAIHQ